MSKITFISILFSFLLLSSCTANEKLKEVSVADFAAFVKETAYITEAESFNWSIVQRDVDNFDVLYGIDWRCPDGEFPAQAEYPVTQVSYNDALAYAKWSDSRLPSYEEYWEMVDQNTKVINQSSTQIFRVGATNTIGNVWEITVPDAMGRVRLAGGSYLCSPNSCNGTSPDRVLYVDKMTGNTHISFAVIRSD